MVEFIIKLIAKNYAPEVGLFANVIYIALLRSECDIFKSAIEM